MAYIHDPDEHVRLFNTYYHGSGNGSAPELGSLGVRGSIISIRNVKRTSRWRTWGWRLILQLRKWVNRT